MDKLTDAELHNLATNMAEVPWLQSLIAEVREYRKLQTFLSFDIQQYAREYVATWKELPSLSGIGSTEGQAVTELQTAIAAYLETI
jgi:hypothetical protein